MPVGTVQKPRKKPVSKEEKRLESAPIGLVGGKID